MENRATCKNTGIGTIQKEFGTSFAPESTRYAKMNQTMPKDHRRQLESFHWPNSDNLSKCSSTVSVLWVHAEHRHTSRENGRTVPTAKCHLQTDSISNRNYSWMSKPSDRNPIKKKDISTLSKFFPIKYLKCWWEKW